MKALVITSNKPRHIEFTCEIAKYFELCGIISQPKSNYYNRDHQAKNQQIVEHLNNLQEYSLISSLDGAFVSEAKSL